MALAIKSSAFAPNGAMTVDGPLGDLGTATKADVEAAMRGHVLEQAEVAGTYQGASGPARARRR